MGKNRRNRDSKKTAMITASFTDCFRKWDRKEIHYSINTGLSPFCAQECVCLGVYTCVQRRL